MSKWPMRGHFRHLHFKTFPMTPRKPQSEVFWPLLSNSKHSGVPEDSKSPTLGVWVSSSHLAKVGLRQLVYSLMNQFKTWTQWPMSSMGIMLFFYQMFKNFSPTKQAGWKESNKTNYTAMLDLFSSWLVSALIQSDSSIMQTIIRS